MPSPETDHVPPDVDAGAVRVARNATLADRFDDRLVVWLVEDQIALYEWAKGARRPFLNTAGNSVPGMWSYPSPNEAQVFLGDYREARERRFETADART